LDDFEGGFGVLELDRIRVLGLGKDDIVVEEVQKVAVWVGNELKELVGAALEWLVHCSIT
jgi:hypothetical protein